MDFVGEGQAFVVAHIVAVDPKRLVGSGIVDVHLHQVLGHVELEHGDILLEVGGAEDQVAAEVGGRRCRKQRLLTSSATHCREPRIKQPI